MSAYRLLFLTEQFYFSQNEMEMKLQKIKQNYPVVDIICQKINSRDMKFGETVKSCIECWNFSIGDRDNHMHTVIWQY